MEGLYESIYPIEALRKPCALRARCENVDLLKIYGSSVASRGFGNFGFGFGLGLVGSCLPCSLLVFRFAGWGCVLGGCRLRIPPDPLRLSASVVPAGFALACFGPARLIHPSSPPISPFGVLG